MSVVEGTFLLRSNATEEMASMEVKADALEKRFVRLGETMDASMTKGAAGAKGSTAAHGEHVGAMDASALAAERAATKHEQSAKRTSKAWSDSGSSMVRTGKMVLATILAVGAGTVDLASKYEATTKQFQTQAGMTERAAHTASKGILDMAGDVGQTPQKLAEGFYHVASSMNNLLPPTKRVHIELGVLKEAAKGAAIGGSNMAETAYVLSSAMNALGRRDIPLAHKTMAELNAIVGTGDMHMQDLVRAMSTGLVSSAKTFGVSLQSVGAALAYMTDRGVPAQQAATRLRMSLSLMGAPTKQAAGILHDLGLTHVEVTTRTKGMDEALKESGVSLTDLSRDMRQPDGIYVALKDLKSRMTDAGVSAETQAAIISRAFGGGRSGGAIMAMYNNLDVVRAKYAQQTKVINSYDEDWRKSQETLTFQLHQAEGAVEAVGIRVGDKLIPAVEKGLELLKDTAHWFATNKGAAEALAYVVGTVMVASLTALAVNGGRKLLGLGRDFYGFGKSIAQMPGAVSGRIAGAFGSPAVATGAEGGIGGADTATASWGIRSMTGPGSEMNPLAVFVTDSMGSPLAAGSGAAMSTEANAGIKGEQAATAGAQGRLFGDVGEQATLFPVGAGGSFTSLAPEAAGVTAAAGPGRLALIRSALGKVAGGAAGAGLAGGMAFGGAELLGSLIPGGAGRTISGSAAGAGVGAAVGSLVGAPWLGALAGGGIQALAKTLGAHGSGGDILTGAGGGAAAVAPLAAVSGVAAPAVLGLGALVGGSLGAFTGATGSSTILKKQIAQVEADVKANKGSAAMGAARMLPAALGEQQFGNSSEEDKARAQVEAYMHRVFRGVAEHTGLESASHWTKSFQSGLKHGESSETAVSGLIKGVELELGKLGPSGRLGLAKAMDSWAQQMAAKEPAMAEPMHELEHDISQRMDALGQHVAFVNGQILTGSTTQWLQIAKAIESPTAVAQEKLAGTFGAMHQEAISALTMMGFSASAAKELVGGLGHGLSASLVGKGVFTPQTMAANAQVKPHGALGMRVPGPDGPDSVGVFGMGGGLRGIVAPGELLVANRHTERRVNGMLARYGTSLGAEVAGETVPHYASGGFFPDPGTNFNYGQEPQIAGDLGRMGQAMGWHVYGISGYRSPAHSLAVGGFANDPHTRGEAADVGINSNTLASAAVLSAALLSRYGLERPFYPASAHEINHIQLLKGAAQRGGAGGFPAAAGSASGISVPAWGGPGGIFAGIGVALTRGVGNAINAGLSGIGAPGGGSGGGGGAVPLMGVIGRPGGGNAVGASEYGGPSDPSSGVTGYHGDNLMQHPNSYAELDMGHALGGLPYMAPLRVTGPKGAMTLYKRDIGLGGGPVDGHPRAIDLWYEAASALGVHGLGVVDVQRMGKGGAMPGWGGWHKDGGTFVASRPTVIGVGDGGEETVHIAKRGRGGSYAVGRGAVTLQVNIDRIENNRPGDIAKIIHSEIEALARAVEEEHNAVPHENEAGLLV